MRSLVYLSRVLDRQLAQTKEKIHQSICTCVSYVHGTLRYLCIVLDFFLPFVSPCIDCIATPAFRLAMYRLYSNVNSLNSGKRAIASNTAAVPHVQSEIVGRGATCDSRVFTCRMCPQDFFAKCLDLGVTKGAAST